MAQRMMERASSSMSDSSFRPDATSIAGQSIKLEKACVSLLRTFLEIHREDLDRSEEEDCGLRDLSWLLRAERQKLHSLNSTMFQSSRHH